MSKKTETKSNELLALGFASDAEAYIGAARQLQDFKSFGVHAIFSSVMLSNSF